MKAPCTRPPGYASKGAGLVADISRSAKLQRKQSVSQLGYADASMALSPDPAIGGHGDAATTEEVEGTLWAQDEAGRDLPPSIQDVD